MHAAAAVPTVEMPVVDVGRASWGLVLHRGLLATAAVVVVGAGALAIGALTAPSSVDGAATNAPSTSAEPESDIDTVALAAEPAPEVTLATRLHDEVSDALPRVQAATAAGMLEGSGAFITPEGHLITSSRLVAEADYLLVWTDDGSRWDAEVIAFDRFSDVAVLRVEQGAVTTGSFGSVAFKPGAELWAGQYAIAVDHDAGSMTVGQISSLAAAAPSDVLGDRSSRFDVEPGMAPGAAIVDDSGAIIGLVNASSHSQATPSWMVERVASDLLRAGWTEHAWLGVHVDIDPTRTSARVLEVVPGSPAEQAGLRVGDLIDAVGDQSISTTASLWTLVQRQAPGDRVDLAVTRNGERRLIGVELAALPD